MTPISPHYYVTESRSSSISGDKVRVSMNAASFSGHAFCNAANYYWLSLTLLVYCLVWLLTFITIQ